MANILHYKRSTHWDPARLYTAPDPAPPELGVSRKKIVQAEFLGAEGLILLNWRCYDDRHEGLGTQLFSLNNLEGKPLWGLEMSPGSSFAGISSGACRFDLLDSTSSQRIEYCVRYDERGELSVEETGRARTTAIPHQRPRFRTGRFAHSARSNCAHPMRKGWRCAGDVVFLDEMFQALGPPKAFASLAVDRTGRIYAVERAARVVRAFDPQAALLQSYYPRLINQARDITLGRITVSDEGDIYLCGDMLGDGWGIDYLHYSPKGERWSLESMPFERCLGWYRQPRTGYRWVVYHNRIDLLDRDGRPLSSIAHCPDGRWLSNPRRASVAPDGSLAVVARAAVSLFTSSGAAIRVIPLPTSISELSGEIAFDGRRVVIIQHDEMYLVDGVESCSGPLPWS